MLDKTFTIHDGPGCDYLKVTKNDLSILGLAVQDFSDFSKRSPIQSDELYLVDDYGDALKFKTAYKKKYGFNIRTEDHTSNLHILAYPMIWE